MKGVTNIHSILEKTVMQQFDGIFVNVSIAEKDFERAFSLVMQVSPPGM